MGLGHTKQVTATQKIIALLVEGHTRVHLIEAPVIAMLDTPGRIKHWQNTSVMSVIKESIKILLAQRLAWTASQESITIGSTPLDKRRAKTVLLARTLLQQRRAPLRLVRTA